MRIAIQGCCHGELEEIYAEVERREELEKKSIDVVVICGDMETMRNSHDLQCLATPEKYRHMASFHKYYSGELKAKWLTIFVGGNHEASNVLQALPYGGWVAPNIWYLGYSGVVRVGYLRIGGLSGIFDGRDYCTGHHEITPYGQKTLRTVYHTRECEVLKLGLLGKNHSNDSLLDIMLVHDWPRYIWEYGDVQKLLQQKPFFRTDIQNGQLGSPVSMELIRSLKPRYCFAAHMHVKFTALIPHIHTTASTTGNTTTGLLQDPNSLDIDDFINIDDENKTQSTAGGGKHESMTPTFHTEFLALDKCLPKRKFLEVMDIFPSTSSRTGEIDTEINKGFYYDLEWLAILKATHDQIPTSSTRKSMKSFRLNEADLNQAKMFVSRAFPTLESLRIPENFKITAPVYDSKSKPICPKQEGNYQTDDLFEKLQLSHRFTIPDLTRNECQNDEDEQSKRKRIN